MTKVYQNYRFFWCIANFLLDTFSTSDTQFDLWSFLVHLYPDFQIQLFTPNKLCFDKVSPRLYIRLGRHWRSTDLHRQAARDRTSHRRNQNLYRENERDWRCGRKPDCVCREFCERTMQGTKPKCYFIYCIMIQLQGDSGGPLQCNMKDGRWYLAGLTSFGSGCAKPGFPDVFTRLTHYLEWINSTLALH